MKNSELVGLVRLFKVKDGKSSQVGQFETVPSLDIAKKLASQYGEGEYKLTWSERLEGKNRPKRQQFVVSGVPSASTDSTVLPTAKALSAFHAYGGITQTDVRDMTNIVIDRIQLIADKQQVMLERLSVEVDTLINVVQELISDLQEQNTQESSSNSTNPQTEIGTLLAGLKGLNADDLVGFLKKESE